MARDTGRRVLVVAAAWILGVGGALAPAFARPIAAAGDSFGTPTATFDYGEQIVFRQPVVLGAAPTRVEILIDYPAALGPNVTEIPGPTGAGSRTLTYTLRMADAHVLPNTPLTAHWRISTGGAIETGPNVKVLYEDTGFKWRTQTGTLVTIHWYNGNASFGQRALDIAEAGVKQAETTLGVTEKDPIDFYVYAEQDAFYAALGPGTPENVGGEEHSEIRTMFALITPGEVNASWVQQVLPHELTHLVFNTAVENPYHFPPRWLNEGLAVYLSVGYGSDDKGRVTSAARDGSLTPLDGLAGNFPTTRDQFFLAYAESVSAVDFMVRTYSKPALVALIRSYAQGVTDDEAFKAALGVDTAGFTTAWLTDLKAKTPVKVGPKPAPAGPLPAGWSGAVLPGGPVATGDGGANAPKPGYGQGDDSSGFLLVLGVLAVLVIGGGAFVIGRRSVMRPRS